MLSDFFKNLISKISFVSEHNHRHNRNIYDVFRKVLKVKKSIAVAFSIMFSLTVTVSYASPLSFEIAIVDGDNYYSLMTPKATVAEVLASNGVEISKYDIVSPELDNLVTSSQTIVIERVNKVQLTLAGETREYYTTADTVEEFLDEKGITLNYHDMINLSPEAELTSDNDLEIVRVVKRIVEVNKEIPYETDTVSDTSMSISESKILAEGINGIDCETYEVILHDGVEISREHISTSRVQDPVNEIKAVGTRGERITEKGENFTYSRLIPCTATAYDLSFQSCGKRPGDRGYGITASGTYAKPGTVAVDPRVIPLGTKMYIETADGSFSYGYCVAEDTGGAIKGNKVDLFFNTNYECMQFGRRSVNVYILD